MNSVDLSNPTTYYSIDKFSETSLEHVIRPL